MDDDDNDAALIEELRTEIAAQKAAMLAILRVIEDNRPGATIMVAQEVAEQADRVGQIDQPLSDALWDLSDEIRMRG